MKKLIIAIIAFVALTGITVSAQTSKEATPKKTEKVYFTCDMDCHSCEQKIGDELRFTKGVRDLKVDHETKTVYVEFKTAKTDKSKIAEAIKKVEYTPKEISEEDYKKLTSKE